MPVWLKHTQNRSEPGHSEHNTQAEQRVQAESPRKGTASWGSAASCLPPLQGPLSRSADDSVQPFPRACWDRRNGLNSNRSWQLLLLEGWDCQREEAPKGQRDHQQRGPGARLGPKLVLQKEAPDRWGCHRRRGPWVYSGTYYPCGKDTVLFFTPMQSCQCTQWNMA